MTYWQALFYNFIFQIYFYQNEILNGFFGLMVFLFNLSYGVIFSPLGFYLFGRLDLVYRPSSIQETRKIIFFLLHKPKTLIRFCLNLVNESLVGHSFVSLKLCLSGQLLGLGSSLCKKPSRLICPTWSTKTVCLQCQPCF